MERRAENSTRTFEEMASGARTPIKIDNDIHGHANVVYPTIPQTYPQFYAKLCITKGIRWKKTSFLGVFVFVS
jgi:hypothetical protein